MLEIGELYVSSLSFNRDCVASCRQYFRVLNADELEWKVISEYGNANDPVKTFEKGSVLVEGELAWWTGKDCLYIELFDNFEFQFILENGVFVMQEDGIFGMMNLNKFSQSIMSGYDFKW